MTWGITEARLRKSEYNTDDMLWNWSWKWSFSLICCYIPELESRCAHSDSDSASTWSVSQPEQPFPSSPDLSIRAVFLLLELQLCFVYFWIHSLLNLKPEFVVHKRISRRQLFQCDTKTGTSIGRDHSDIKVISCILPLQVKTNCNRIFFCYLHGICESDQHYSSSGVVKFYIKGRHSSKTR